MINLCKLSQLNECESAVVKEIHLNGSMRRRLQDLGLITGTKVKCIFKNPSGNTAAFCVRGAVIALRKCDSALIDVLPCAQRK